MIEMIALKSIWTAYFFVQYFAKFQNIEYEI